MKFSLPLKFQNECEFVESHELLCAMCRVKQPSLSTNPAFADDVFWKMFDQQLMERCITDPNCEECKGRLTVIHEAFFEFGLVSFFPASGRRALFLRHDLLNNGSGQLAMGRDR